MLGGLDYRSPDARAADTVYRTRVIVSATDPAFGVRGDGNTDDAPAYRLAVAAATNKWLYVPNVNSKIGSVIDLPRSIRITGTTRRGLDNGVNGSRLFAAFAGPVFRYAPGGLTSADILIENMTIKGNKGTYGAGNGVEFTNCADTTIRECVVANFGTNNIAVSGGNYCTMEDVYSATAGNANFYIDADHCKIRNCSGDTGVYSVQSTANGSDLSIDGGSWFEGATTAGINIGGQRTVIDQTTVNMTAGGKGIITNASARPHLGTGVKILGEGTAASTIGLDLGTSIEYQVTGILCSGFQTAAKVTSGFGSITGGQFEGTVTGLDMTATGFGMALCVGATFSGPTNSVLHNAGTKARYVGCRYDDGLGNYKAPTVSAGSFISLDGSLTRLVQAFTSSVTGSPIGIAALIGDEIIITFDNGAAYTISAPTFPTTGQRMTFTARNTSGGAMGVITWNAVFKMVAFVNPANGFSRSIEFRYDGTNWVEINRTAADVPN